MQSGDMLQHYKLIRLLGKGGFGEVFLAYDTFLDIEVAIKVLLPKYASDEEMVRRFHIGAKAAARLQHPNIIRVLYMGELSRGQVFFTVMEYLSGGTLADRLHGTAMPFELALATMVKISDAVSFAHANGFIHRDLKPQNILYSQNDEPVITDFDLSRVIGQTRLTRSDVALGTLLYLPPEQALGEEVYPQSDVYSLGVMLFLMLTGKLPFESPNPIDLVQMHLSKLAPRPSQINSALPQSIDSVIQKTMAKQPEHRYESAAAFSDALIHILPDSSQIRRVKLGETANTNTVPKVQAVLMVEAGKHKGLRVPLHNSVFRVGYSTQDKNHLGLDDDYVSNYHGSFEFREEGWVYIDQHSTNGTFLINHDGSKHRLAPEVPFKLTFGDVLELGDTHLRFEPQYQS